MRTIILLLIATFALTGCEDIETNSPALQAKIDGELFRAVDARAEINPDGTVSIRGLNSDETLVLTLTSSNPGTYNLGGNSSNKGAFRISQGGQFTTDPNGDGQVVIQNSENNVLSGTFFFNATAGAATLVASEGLFFQVPVVSGNTGGDNPANNSLSAKVNGANFNAAAVQAVNSGNFVLISAASADGASISLTVPISLVPGNYDITSNNIEAVYISTAAQSPAVSGSLTITTHNTTSEIMSGTFAFETGPPNNISVTEGQFSLSY